MYELFYECLSMNWKVLCLRVKSSMAHTIWESGQFVGSGGLYFSMN